MSAGYILVEDEQGSRRFEPDTLPLALGGAGAALNLPGLGAGETVAWLGGSEGEIFLQSEGVLTILCNGTPVSASQWLHDGDRLRVGAVEVLVHRESDGWRLQARAIDEENITAPPAVVAEPAPPAEDDAGTSTIRAVEFQPRQAAAPARRRRRVRGGTLVLAAIVVVLAAVAWLLFSMRAVQVQVEPEPDRVGVRGALIPWEIGGWRLLLPGTYQVYAEREGYRPLEEDLEVTDQRNQVHAFTMSKLPGFLAIDAGEVTGAVVNIDGEDVGTTPLAPVELAPGEHEVWIQAERYRVFATQVTIEGEGVTQTLVADLEPNWAGVTFRSEPGGATVRANGRSLGKTPLTEDLAAGTYKVEFTLAGYKTYRRTVTVKANEAREVPVARLEVADATLSLKSDPSGAAVDVDGVYRGETPIDLVLSPGVTHEIELSKAGHDPAAAEVRIGPGQRRTETVTLTPQEGEVEFAVEPAGADLFLNGKRKGKASGTMRLVALPTKIELRKDGYESYETTLTPRPGYPQVVRAKLRSIEEAKAAAIPKVTRSPQGHQMVRIDDGRFRMGASRREPGRRANETYHEVELTRPFYISTTEVTNAEFRQFRKAHSSGRVGSRSLDVDSHPVVRVSWEEAARYCNWLSGQAGLPPAYQMVGGKMAGVRPMTTGYRMPTEAEWARAARFPGGSNGLKYPWGSKLPVPADAGNFADESAKGLLSDTLSGYNDSYAGTAPVGSFPPNPLGLLDLGGNVAEWVHDIYTIHGPGSGKTDRDPLGPEEGDLHVIRGAGWMDGSPSELRLSYRDYAREGRPDVGFRIARYAQ